MKIPRWAQVLIGVGIVAVFLGIGAIVAISAYFSQHVVITDTTSERQVDEEFEKVRQKFSGRAPLIQIKDGVAQYSPVQVASGATPHTLTTLHILAWDAREEKLASVDVPWWIVRMKSGPIRFSSYASGFDDEGVSLRPDDIERHGPGVIMDTSVRNGRVLLWAQ